MSNTKRYAAVYFKKTAEVAKKHFKDDKVVIQFFQWKDNLTLAGIKFVLDLLNKETNANNYSIKHRNDGDIINAKDVVLELSGPYHEFGEYEGIIDGILSRATSIATNARKLIEVANGKKVVAMIDRADYYLNQQLDGYAASIGGVNTQVTKANIENHSGDAIGTIPHVLIQMNQGDLIKALHQYKELHGCPLTALVDYNNDVISDSLKALKEFKEELSALRVDTSRQISDAYFINDEEYGVTPNLIKALRKALDDNNGQHVKIIVSGGFNVEKIKEFEDQNTPVDIYGVGKSLLDIFANFTGDAVMINDKEEAKFGRKYNKI